ncbi:hypothetical protein Daus18300_005511 [Diaporthe australafricana]|uniref:Uncharacterized protein n=1 Tax=Diaporthe australafricana TaxID=127596 RepID=A0ABR3X129_9PEZI
MRCVAIVSFATLALVAALNPQVEEGNKALAALQDVSPEDASAVQMVSEDQRQDQGVTEILSTLGQNSPDDAEAAKGLGRRDDDVASIIAALQAESPEDAAAAQGAVEKRDDDVASILAALSQNSPDDAAAAAVPVA